MGQNGNSLVKAQEHKDYGRIDSEDRRFEHRYPQNDTLFTLGAKSVGHARLNSSLSPTLGEACM